jgi:hypothetical protein
MVIAGASQTAVIRFVQDIPGAWRSRRGLILALLNDQYVAAGVRDVETAQRLKALHASGVRRQLFRSQKAKTRDVREHEWAGLMACGQCVDAGYSTDECRMYGRYIQSNPNPWNVVCAGTRNGKAVHPYASISVHKLLAPLLDRLWKLRDPDVAQAVIERWQQEPTSDASARLRASLGAAIAKCDVDEAAIDTRVNAAIRLMVSDSPGVAKEAERVLGRANADRLAITAQRAGLMQKLADLPAPRRRTVDARELLGNAEAMMIDPAVDFQPTFRRWITAIGPPIWYGRKKRAQGRRLDSLVDLRWPFIDDVRPEAARSTNKLMWPSAHCSKLAMISRWMHRTRFDLTLMHY